MNRIPTARRIVAFLGRKFRQMSSSRAWSVIIAAICLLATAKPVAAVTFNLNFVAGANNPNDPTGAGLMTIMRAAADRWTDIIEDSHTMTINVSYYVNDATGNGPCVRSEALACAAPSSANAANNRTVVGEILFNADLTSTHHNWYIDPTPAEDSEFGFTHQTLYRDLTPAQQSAGYSALNVEPLLEVGFTEEVSFSDPNANGNYDMLSTALHEIGHLLGVTNLLHAGAIETTDGDYDLPPSLLAGRTMAVKAVPGDPHFVDASPLMTGAVAITSYRRLPAAADVLAAAEVSGWSLIDLPRKDFLSGSVWENAANWEGNRTPDIQDDVFVRHGGSVDISTTANGGAANLLVGDSSQLRVRGTLIANGNVTIDGGVLTRDSTANFTLVPFKTMTIENGGLATFSGDYNLAANATYIVKGASTWTNGSEFRVGFAGTGTLMIEDGGAVSNYNGYVGYSAGVHGDVTVTGVGSTWTNSSGLYVGYDGIGTLRIEDGAAVNSYSSGVVGLFAGSNGEVTVTDSLSTWTTSSLSVGGDVQSGGTGYINVQNGGLVQASGNVKVWVNGAIDVQAGGTLIANGNVTVNGGAITRFSGGTFSLAAGKTMTVENGGLVQAIGSFNTASNATYNITGTKSSGIGSRLDSVAGGTLSIINGAVVNVSAGGSLFAITTIQIGFSNGTNGTLIVDGPGSSATTPGAGASIWGFGGSTATVTFKNNASGSFSQVSLAHSTTAGTTGLVSIQTGADVTFTNNLNLAVLGGATTSATLSVQGNGSTVTQTGGSALTVGHSTTGAAAINIGTTASGAIFNTGSGTTTINKTGTVTIGSGANTGTLNANGNVLIDGGVLDHNAGSFTLAAGKNLTAQNNGNFSFTGTHIITGGSTYTFQSGADFSTTATTFGNGTLLVDGIGSTLAVSAATQLGSSGLTGALTVRNGATADLNGVLGLADASTAHLSGGIVNVQSGATITTANIRIAPNSTNGQTGVFTVGNGVATSRVTQDANATLVVGGSLTNGPVPNFGTLNINSGGEFNSGAGTGTITVNRTGTMNVANGGTLNAKGHVTIDAGMFQVGSGGSVIVVAGKTMTIVNDGTLRGSGSVTGNVVNSSGVVAPGNSPGALTITGNYTQSTGGKLAIELAGTSPGSGYDQLLVSGSATLAGSLDVSLIAFTPQFYQQFTILSAGSIVSNGFVLAGSAASSFSLVVNSTSVILQAIGLPGDYNHNNVVDAADYVGWRKTDGTQVGYNTWRANFGHPNGSGSETFVNASVPEPTTAMLLLFAAAVWSLPRRRAA